LSMCIDGHASDETMARPRRIWYAVHEAMNIQIFGTLKCQETRKAQRYFKERGIPFQFVNLAERGLSKGELQSVKAVIGIENLIDREGKEYARRNLKYLTHNAEEELLNYPLLFRTPIVRNGGKVTVGYRPEAWGQWE
jgi:arsenate reductase (glutaredoxin)